MKCLRPTTTDGLGVGRAGERRRRYTKMAQTFAEAKLENLYRTGAIFLHFFVAAPNAVNEDSEIGCRRTCNCCYQVVGIPHLPGPALNGRYCQPRSPRMDRVGWPGASGAKRSMGSTLCRWHLNISCPRPFLYYGIIIFIFIEPTADGACASLWPYISMNGGRRIENRFLSSARSDRRCRSRQ